MMKKDRLLLGLVLLSGAAGLDVAKADNVVADDQIVQGSACIGLDCVDNENFGFDTLRLKENNVRIRFQDTSTGPGFPANNWSLIANDSANGGRNYFAIEDSTLNRLVFGVSAGAPAYAMWINSAGNVGLGTENPTLKLHLVNDNTPGIRLEQTNTGGFTAQTWDIAGNEANFFIRDTTNGSRLPFRIRPGAPTSSIDIASNGFVGFGTASPTAQIHATGTIRFESLSGCGSGIGTDSLGYLSCIASPGSTLVQQTNATAPITVGATTGGTQVTVNGTGGNRVVSGVGNGAVASNSTDAINGSQLFSANQRVASAFGGGASIGSDGMMTAPSYTIDGRSYNNVGDALGAIGTGGTTYFRSNNTGPAASATGTNANAIGTGSSASGGDALAFGTNAQATQSGAIAIGLNSASTGTNAIAIGTGATATGSVAVGFNASASNGGAAYGDGAVATATNATAIGPNSRATAANAVAIGSGSTNTVANTVSVGSAGNERRITNVAAGVNATDAVNVSQLQSVTAGFQAQMAGLQTQVYDNRIEARRGIAASVATASAPMPSAAGRTSWQARASTFQGQTGVGFGFAHRLNTSAPLAIVGGYGNGGGVQHTGYIGMGGEF